MKRILEVLIFEVILIVILMLMIPSEADSQQSLVKDSKGYYIPKTVKTIGPTWYGLYGADTNWTTEYILIPPGVKSVVCYLEIDSAGTTDTLDVAIYGSSTTTTTKGSLITSFTASAIVARERKEIAIPDRYIYFTGTYKTGSTFPKRKVGKIIVSPRQ